MRTVAYIKFRVAQIEGTSISWGEGTRSSRSVGSDWYALWIILWLWGVIS